MDHVKQKFPVKTYDLNSQEQLEALFAEYATRSRETTNQAELGLHGVYSVRSAEDIPKLLDQFDLVAFTLSEFEIRFMNDIQTVGFIPISAQGYPLKLVVSGGTKAATDISRISIALYAENVVVRNLKWGNTDIKTALTVGAKETIELDHLEFADNKHDSYYNDIAEPRVTLVSIAESGQYTNLTANHLTFKHNQTNALIMLDKDSMDRFGTLSFDHLTLSDNQTQAAGVDVSAAKKVTLSHVTITGHTGSSALTQRTPNAEIVISASALPENAYKYVPLAQYKDKAAKPIKIEK